MSNRRCTVSMIAVALLAVVVASRSVSAAPPVPANPSVPSTQPTLTAHAPDSDFIPVPGPIRMIFGKTVVVAKPDKLNAAKYDLGSATDAGFCSQDQTVFYGVQIYSVTGSVESLTDKTLAPAAIEQLRARWGSLIAADAPIDAKPSPDYVLELHYSMHLCHGAVPITDRYARVGKDLMRVTVIPMSQTLTADQFTALSAAAEATTLKIIDSAKPYDEQAEQEELKRQRAAFMPPTRATAPTPVQAVQPTPVPGPGPAPTAPFGVAGGGVPPKPGKETPADKLNHRAELALAQAQKLKDDGKDIDAYQRFKFVAKEYAKTPSADAANQAVADFEADADFMAKYNGKSHSSAPVASGNANSPDDASAKAKALISLGDNYITAGRPELAKKKYQAVIDQYPSTPEAAIAKQKLSGM